MTLSAIDLKKKLSIVVNFDHCHSANLCAHTPQAMYTGRNSQPKRISIHIACEKVKTKGMMGKVNWVAIFMKKESGGCSSELGCNFYEKRKWWMFIVISDLY